jgi:2-C-methyl-D-erythritol 4-phosphate cytidylyltransferase
VGRFTLLLLAGGVGNRMDSDVPKQITLLNGTPMLIYSLHAAEEIEEFEEIIIPCPEDYLNRIKDVVGGYSIGKKIRFVVGGSTRQESVYLSLLENKSANVVIHESARPLVKPDYFKTLINDSSDNVIYGLDIPFTVLYKDMTRVSGVIDRKNIFNVELPHKYNALVLLEAHKKAMVENKFFTEDASLVFHYGGEVKIVPGHHENIKITTWVDYLIAEKLLEERGTL